MRFRVAIHGIARDTRDYYCDSLGSVFRWALRQTSSLFFCVVISQLFLPQIFLVIKRDWLVRWNVKRFTNMDSDIHQWHGGIVSAFALHLWFELVSLNYVFKFGNSVKNLIIYLSSLLKAFLEGLSLFLVVLFFVNY